MYYKPLRNERRKTKRFRLLRHFQGTIQRNRNMIQYKYKQEENTGRGRLTSLDLSK